MSTLQLHMFLPTSSPRRHGFHRQMLMIRTPTTTPRNPGQALVLNVHQVQPQRDMIIGAPPAVDDPAGLKSMPSHLAWLAAGCATVLFSLVKAAVVSVSNRIWVLQPLLAGYIGYILADLGSGVYHWGIDNYGDASTPLLGSQLEAAQGHHKWPWTITRRQCANNLHALARGVALLVLPVDLVCNDPTVLSFVGMFAGCIMFSQQFHAWAHGTKSKLPAVVVALQDAGVLVSRVDHPGHHRPPYNSNYCIVSGMWNELLDKKKVFEVLEMVVYFKLGVKPKSWSQPDFSSIVEEAEITVV